jgi:uncharacterized membrane protein
VKAIRVNKLKVGSFAKVVGITQAVFGFVYGLFLTVGVASEAINEDTTFVATLGVSLLTLGMSILILPLVAFVIGWVQGAIMALILNFVFQESDGLQLEIEDVK